MKQIKIGTCIPGDKVETWLPHFIKAGFETISINFHMTLNGTDLVKLSQRVKEIIGDSGAIRFSGNRIKRLWSTAWNALPYSEHRRSAPSQAPMKGNRCRKRFQNSERSSAILPKKQRTKI